MAELLRVLVGYARGTELDVRWWTLKAPPEFFVVTKRLHHALHGAVGDGSALDEHARAVYEEALRPSGQELCLRVRAGDLVVVHDPQPAGLMPLLERLGARVIWRCHIGVDAHNAETDAGWRFLRPYLGAARRHAFTRAAYIPGFLDPAGCPLITPCVDPFSPKCAELTNEQVREILAHVGLCEGPSSGAPRYVRADGSPGRVERCADVLQLGGPPPFNAPLVLQVSRWDSLKDPVGVLEGFAAAFGAEIPPDAHLLLVGPGVHAVADDPEAAGVYEEVRARWHHLPHAVRRHVHLCNLPTADDDENAVIVNALQRHAAVVVQKSLREGFGLTVTEAMWKARPIVASEVGGLMEQISTGSMACSCPGALQTGWRARWGGCSVPPSSGHSSGGPRGSACSSATWCRRRSPPTPRCSRRCCPARRPSRARPRASPPWPRWTHAGRCREMPAGRRRWRPWLLAALVVAAAVVVAREARTLDDSVRLLKAVRPGWVAAAVLGACAGLAWAGEAGALSATLLFRVLALLLPMLPSLWLSRAELRA